MIRVRGMKGRKGSGGLADGGVHRLECYEQGGSCTVS